MIEIPTYTQKDKTIENLKKLLENKDFGRIINEGFFKISLEYPNRNNYKTTKINELLELELLLDNELLELELLLDNELDDELELKELDELELLLDNELLELELLLDCEYCGSTYKDEKEKAKFNQMVASYREEDNRLYNLFKEGLYYYFMLEQNSKAEKLFEIAWDKGHAYGYYEVFQQFKSLVDLIK